MDLINVDFVNSVPQANIAWILVLVIGIIFTVISIILMYHWQRYGIHKGTVRLVMITYFTISAILLYSLVQVAINMSTI